MVLFDIVKMKLEKLGELEGGLGCVASIVQVLGTCARLVYKEKIPSQKAWDCNMVRLAGLEPVTPTMSRWCSNQLSYSRVKDGADDKQF